MNHLEKLAQEIEENPQHLPVHSLCVYAMYGLVGIQENAMYLEDIIFIIISTSSIEEQRFFLNKVLRIRHNELAKHVDSLCPPHKSLLSKHYPSLREQTE